MLTCATQGETNRQMVHNPQALQKLLYMSPNLLMSDDNVSFAVRRTLIVPSGKHEQTPSPFLSTSLVLALQKDWKGKDSDMS